MVSVTPSIDRRVFDLAPEFRALSITVKGSAAQDFEHVKNELAQACHDILHDDYHWAESHINAWSEAYKNFGSKPNRTPSSAAALRKRVFKIGSIPNIDPIVDIYNAVSIRYAIPIGGEDVDKYQGSPVLTIADGTEIFDTVKNGEPSTETPDVGEVVWRDDVGVTCRRWNWRQGARTRIDSDTTNMWFVMESLPEMPLEKLLEAGQRLIRELKKIMPNAEFDQLLISSEGTTNVQAL